MRRINRLAAPLALALALGACGAAQNSGSAPLVTTPPSSTPTTGAPTPTSTTVPAPHASSTIARPPTSIGGAPTTTVPEPPVSDLTGFQTEPFRKEHFLTVPPVPIVTAVRVAHHPGFDRVVFDLTGQLPGAVSVRYVDRVVADGSGDPVTLAGRAFLLVRLEEAHAHTDSGQPTIARRPPVGSLTTVREIAVAGDYEGYVTVAFGLSERAAFRVIELTNPSRVVVDVRSLT